MSTPPDRWSVSLSGATLLDRYRVDRTIGAGGMATVHLAHDEQLDQPVVVKVPHPAFLAEPGFRDRFERETRDLVSLQHPHIVRILARGEHEDLPFLVMQYLQGGSLGARMREAGGALPFAQVRPWMRDIARALDFIHDRGIVHRDMKPDNVLFDEHGHAYLSDFGIAKAVGGADTGLTMTGATPGSPAYMAPEQAVTSTLTGRSDQYALAATLYEALSGRPTFDGETVLDVLMQKQRSEPTPLSAVAPSVPAPAAAAIMRALARDPEARFDSCTELVESVLAAGDRPAGPPPTVVRPTPQPTVLTPPPEPAPMGDATTATPPPVTPPTTGSVGRTATLGGARKAVWVVFAALLAVPLAFVVLPGGGEGPSDTGREGGAAPPLPAPPPADVKSPAAGEAFVGAYELDGPALEERMRAWRERRPSMPRAGATLEDLERALRGGMSLDVHEDGTFRMVPPPRPGQPSRAITGAWKSIDDAAVLEPDAEDGPRAAKRGGGAFRLRRAEDDRLVLQFGKLMLPMRPR